MEMNEGLVLKQLAQYNELLQEEVKQLKQELALQKGFAEDMDAEQEESDQDQDIEKTDESDGEDAVEKRPRNEKVLACCKQHLPNDNFNNMAARMCCKKACGRGNKDCVNQCSGGGGKSLKSRQPNCCQQGVA